MARLAGRTAIVTGGAKGIGAHYCEALAAEGASVVVADIADGNEVAEKIAAKHGRNSTLSETFDVSDETQVKGLVARTIERFGKIDILVNNAALFAPLPFQPVTEIDVATWDKVMAVNVRGPFLMAKHVAPHMKARKYGKIINIGSGTVYKGLPGFLHYSSSKGAIATFTRTLVARARRARHLRQHAVARPDHERVAARKRHAWRRRARQGCGEPRLQARRLSAGSGGGAGFPRLAGQRFHDRADAGGGRRLDQYLICRRPGRGLFCAPASHYCKFQAKPVRPRRK